MNSVAINRKCELSESKNLQDTFNAFIYRRALWEEISKIDDEIKLADVTEESFKESFFTDNFPWDQFFTGAIIIGGVTGIGCWIIFSFFAGLCLFVTSITIYYFICKNRFWNKNEGAIEIFRCDKQKLQARLGELNDKKTSLKANISMLNEYIQQANIIPEKYHDYWAALLGYFHDCRADTLKEAINLLESELHMQHQTRLIEQQNRELERMRCETAEAIRQVESSVDFNTLITSMKR